MNNIINTKIHLDKQFALESFSDELQGLRIDVALKANPTPKTNSFKLPYMNTVFLYYITTTLIGISLFSTNVI